MLLSIYNDKNFADFRDSVSLNYEMFKIYGKLIYNDNNKIEISNIKESTYINSISTTSTTYNTYGTKYISSLDLTIYDNGINYYLDTIFPEEDKLLNLINNISTVSIENLGINHYNVSTDYTWLNAMTNGRFTTYLEYEVMGSSEGFQITAKFSDQYKFDATTRRLLYWGMDKDNWLKDFNFYLESSSNINYLRISSAGLYQWNGSLFEDFNPESPLSFVFGLASKFSVAEVDSILSTFYDPSGYVIENETIQVENKTMNFNEFNYTPLNENKISLILDPKLVLKCELADTSDSIIEGRWKTFSIDIRYDNIYNDIAPNCYKFDIAFKKHLIYGNGDGPILIESRSEHIIQGHNSVYTFINDSTHMRVCTCDGTTYENHTPLLYRMILRNSYYHRTLCEYCGSYYNDYHNWVSNGLNSECTECGMVYDGIAPGTQSVKN